MICQAFRKTFFVFLIPNPKAKEWVITNKDKPMQRESVKASASYASSYCLSIVNTYDPKAIA